MIRKAIIFGVKDYYLTKKERILFKKKKLREFILFTKNIKKKKNEKKLLNKFKII